MKSRTWACPDCDGQFTTVMDDRDGPPKFCTLCGNDMAADIEAIPNFSRIGKAVNQSQDKVFRQMESASIARAEEAAEVAGVPVSEMSHLKLTNQKDNLREGDTSFITPQMPAPSANVNALPNSAGATMAAQMRQSGQGGAGHKVMDMLKGAGGMNHSQRARAMQKAGQMGTFVAPR